MDGKRNSVVRDRSGDQILFTPEGFEPDFPATAESEAEAEKFRKQPWESVYALGFSPADAAEGNTFHWLHTLGLSFVRELTRQPALEISREQTEVPLPPEERGRLMDALPFGIGTEYVTEAWLGNAWEQMTAVFEGKGVLISEYQGEGFTVSVTGCGVNGVATIAVECRATESEG